MCTSGAACLQIKFSPHGREVIFNAPKWRGMPSNKKHLPAQSAGRGFCILGVEALICGCSMALYGDSLHPHRDHAERRAADADGVAGDGERGERVLVGVDKLGCEGGGG